MKGTEGDKGDKGEQGMPGEKVWGWGGLCGAGGCCVRDQTTEGPGHGGICVLVLVGTLARCLAPRQGLVPELALETIMAMPWLCRGPALPTSPMLIRGSVCRGQGVSKARRAPRVSPGHAAPVGRR